MKNWIGTLAVALAAMGWGTWSLFLRGSGLSPWWQSLLILTVIAVAAAPPALLGMGRPRAAVRSWRGFALLGLLGVLDAGNYILFFAAVDRGPIPVAVLTHYFAPVVVAAFAPALLGERLGSRTAPALAVSLLGLGLLLGGGQGTQASVATTALCGFGSALFYGAGTLVGKRLLAAFSNAEVLSYHSAASALLLLPFAPACPPLAAFAGRPLAGALLVGAAGGALFYYGLQRIAAQRAAVLTYLEPLVASLVSALAFGERLGPWGAAGVLLILGAGAAVALQPRSSLS